MARARTEPAALASVERLLLAIGGNSAVSPGLRGRARDLHLRIRFLRETGRAGDQPSPWARDGEG